MNTVRPPSFKALAASWENPELSNCHFRPLGSTRVEVERTFPVTLLAQVIIQRLQTTRKQLLTHRLEASMFEERLHS